MLLRPFSLLAAASLALFVATVILWVRGCFEMDRFEYMTEEIGWPSVRRDIYSLESWCGGFALQRYDVVTCHNQDFDEAVRRDLWNRPRRSRHWEHWRQSFRDLERQLDGRVRCERPREHDPDITAWHGFGAGRRLAGAGYGDVWTSQWTVVTPCWALVVRHSSTDGGV